MVMTKRAENQDVSFTCPMVGPKDYVVKGPSGWPETFRRRIVDTRLESFLRALIPDLDLAELVEVFIARRELLEKPEPTTWFTVIGFLGRTLNMHPNEIPPECGIAFWGKVVIASLDRGLN